MNDGSTTLPAPAGTVFGIEMLLSACAKTRDIAAIVRVAALIFAIGMLVLMSKMFSGPSEHEHCKFKLRSMNHNLVH